MYAEPNARVWVARVGCVVGVLAEVGYIGVACRPVNLHPSLHGLSTKLGFRALLAASLLLVVATAWNQAFSRRAVVGWFSFAFLLAAFIVIGVLAPPGTVRVVAQKVISLASVAIIAFESYQAERFLLAPEGVAPAAFCEAVPRVKS